MQLVQGRKKELEFDNFDEWVERFSGFPLVQLIDLDAAILNEVGSQLEQIEVPLSNNPSRAFFKGTASDAMLEASVRLTKLFMKRDDARVVGPLVVGSGRRHRHRRQSRAHRRFCAAASLPGGRRDSHG